MSEITDEKKTTTITQNVSVKSHPITTIPAIIVFAIGVAMLAIEYVFPYFITLKKQPDFLWWQPLGVFGIALLLAFMNDGIFTRLFNRADKVVEKVTHTESKE